MSEKTLKFDNIKVNKKEFPKSKQPPINLNLVDTNKIVIFDKFKRSHDVLNDLLVGKEMKLLNRCVLSYLK